jgi:hypothetical protein
MLPVDFGLAVFQSLEWLIHLGATEHEELLLQHRGVGGFVESEIASMQLQRLEQVPKKPAARM